MKIYSKDREATVTFITSTGLVFTVGHFYRGQPVLIEGKIPVKTLTVAKKLDYYMGIAPIRMSATLSVEPLDYNMQIVVRGNTVKYGRILAPLNQFFWLTNVPVSKGESGSPVLTLDGKIMGYITHASIHGSIMRPFNDMLLKTIQSASERAKIMNQSEEEKANE